MPPALEPVCVVGTAAVEPVVAPAVVKLVSVDTLGVTMVTLEVVLETALVLRRVAREELMVELAKMTEGVSTRLTVVLAVMTGRVLCSVVEVVGTLMSIVEVSGEMAVAVLEEMTVSGAELMMGDAATGIAAVEIAGTGVA